MGRSDLRSKVRIWGQGRSISGSPGGRFQGPGEVDLGVRGSRGRPGGRFHVRSTCRVNFRVQVTSDPFLGSISGLQEVDLGGQVRIRQG